jgi:hypothetical protein
MHFVRIGQRQARCSGLLLAALAFATPAPAKNVARTVDITIEGAAPGEPAKAGDHNQMRVVYDDAAVDPHTRRARLLNVQHPVDGGFAPAVPDPSDMPVDDAWIDLSAKAPRVHFRAVVTHGKPIVITLDESTRRFELRPADAAQPPLLSGSYVVALRSTSGADIDRAAGGARSPCDRSCLAGLLDRFYAAIAAADPAGIAVSSDLRFTQNGRELQLGDGLWRTPLALQAYRLDALDEGTGQAASNAVVLENGRKVLLFVRLKAAGTGPRATLSEIETTIVRPGEGQRSDPEGLAAPPSLYAETVPGAERGSRTQLVAAADAYLQALQLAGTPAYRSPPLARDVTRVENGVMSAAAPGSVGPTMDDMLRRGFGTDKLYVSERRYPVVDEARGVVVAIGLMHVNYGPRPAAPPGQRPRPRAHATETPNRLQVLVEFFKVSAGEVREIRAQMLDLDDPEITGTGWPGGTPE